MNVSLYIPAFNAERTIAKCIEAVLSQKYPLKEFLVIDDGSIDKTYDIASNYSLKVLRLDNNYGLAAVRNIALNNLDSDFIAAVDSDCVIKDDWLQRLMAQFSESAVAGAGGKLIEENLDSCFDFWRSVHMPQFWEKDDRDPPFLFGANTVFRKKALLSVGGYDESLKNNYEDVDISRRLKEKGFKLRYDPEARAGHLKKDDFISLLRTYWCWNLPDYQRRNFYLSPKSLKEKIYYNNFVIGSYFAQDLKAKRFDLGYIDLLLFLYLSFQDWLYFFDIYKKEASSFDMMAFILSSLGLTFFINLI
ncbi:MAG: glycosyltransferase family 2 protein [Candidatus Omnitrophica bacterium]|nr:glycosyltransferase family 2 protein [Candidatus Omnitrophota bacterium]